MPEPFDLPYVQRALAEVLLLSAAAGLLGTWIVLRGMAFFAHAVGTAAFPGLVLAAGLGFAAPLGAVAAAVAFALATALLARAHGGEAYDAATALSLTGALALGVILASDVFGSGSEVESLLFGSLLAIEWRDVLIAAATSAVAVAATLALGRTWLAAGFDRAAAGALGLRSSLPDLLLFALVALAVIAALPAVGALLVSAIVVVPAATARLWTSRLAPWQLASVALAAAEGTVGLWLSVELNAPPGATIATLGGALFALAALARALGPRRAARAAAVLASCAAMIALPSCGGGDDDADAGAVATTTLIADWAGEVAQDEVEVYALLRAGTDPHDYEPRPEDVEAVAEADLLLVSGRGYDDWTEEIVDAAGGDAEVVDLSEQVPSVTTDGEADPHWWHDPRSALRAVAAIRAELARVEPDSAPAFERNADRYSARLRRLDAALADCFARVPRKQRKLVTDHDAFSYLAHRYRIEVIGAVIPARVSLAQASVRDVAKLAGLVRRERVEAVFGERTTGDRLARAIARETGADVGEQLYAESLGEPGSGADTYAGMMRANADALVRGLSGGVERCRPGSP